MFFERFEVGSRTLLKNGRIARPSKWIDPKQFSIRRDTGSF
ncbi:MAG: hypothetical protein OJF52_004433 [Nitrospira sp.]|nr:MAG: hypothetical protein OJF52_004433 [Nitrospira sp.]